MNELRDIAWLVCGVYATIPAYWMMVHPFVRHWRSARKQRTIMGPLWILLWIAALAISYPLKDVLLYRTLGAWVAAPLLWTITVFTYVRGTHGLSVPCVLGMHELEPDRYPNVLVTSGIHRIVRHPVYLGHICTMLGFAVGSGSAACFALFAFGIVTGAVMIVFEERELHARFGSAWEEYCKCTPAIIPIRKS
ncbi:MAG: hypothetical protein CXZ00_10110 [Acidobacteria bacterium]|nr:MAG: hypothetical protein CXZ00_10110 [Acidobacteriota bacterium]